MVKKILDFDKQQKSKRLKILTTKQMLQRLPIALSKVKEVVCKCLPYFCLCYLVQKY